ncbi:hypothetical protein FLAG1_04632 [Fusarium langsethiae]|uniref:Uncharacterized protein n=1 Tax=Fusarium langsethiae TaxID=179993 RepID=A0A0N0DFE6_FUSLA|nr:hypothetical protein FLAG1_04632 [Fusarium langsethiae]
MKLKHTRIQSTLASFPSTSWSHSHLRLRFISARLSLISVLILLVSEAQDIHKIWLISISYPVVLLHHRTRLFSIVIEPQQWSEMPTSINN